MTLGRWLLVVAISVAVPIVVVVVASGCAALLPATKADIFAEQKKRSEADLQLAFQSTQTNRVVSEIARATENESLIENAIENETQSKATLKAVERTADEDDMYRTAFDSAGAALGRAAKGAMSGDWTTTVSGVGMLAASLLALYQKNKITKLTQVGVEMTELDPERSKECARKSGLFKGKV